MDYNALIEHLKECGTYGFKQEECAEAATAITDLLARAEAAEARCETLEKIVKEYQKELIPGYRERAEKAETERDAAIKQIREFAVSVDRPCACCKHNTGDYVTLGVCGGCSVENDKWEWDGGNQNENQT